MWKFERMNLNKVENGIEMGLENHLVQRELFEERNGGRKLHSVFLEFQMIQHCNMRTN